MLIQTLAAAIVLAASSPPPTAEEQRAAPTRQMHLRHFDKNSPVMQNPCVSQTDDKGNKIFCDHDVNGK